jgi:hypothetical protein
MSRAQTRVSVEARRPEDQEYAPPGEVAILWGPGGVDPESIAVRAASRRFAAARRLTEADVLYAASSAARSTAGLPATVP